MGEELTADGRNAVRTPMQWRDARNGGFSDARPSKLPSPMVRGGFGPEHVNVEAQRRDEGSLLTFIGRLIRRYREAPELGWGELEILDQPERSVLAHLVRLDGDATLAVHNLSAEPATVNLHIQHTIPQTRLVDQLCDDVLHLDDRGRVELNIDGYGYHWYRLSPPDDRRLA